MVIYVPSGQIVPPTSEAAEEPTCDHGVTFDEAAYDALPASERNPHTVRERWPRGWGVCPKGCGYVGIAYASFMHYLAGDW